MNNSKILQKLNPREISVTLENILDNARAYSGGERDVDFLKFLIDNNILQQSEVSLKRTNVNFPEEYFLERYKKVSYETDKHFLCRTIIQDELKKLGIETLSDIAVGNMDILRANSNYDIVTNDFSTIIDVGLTPARNFFRGLTDVKVKHFLITTYFDDYMDDVIFGVFLKVMDQEFLDAVKDYEEGFKIYISNPQPDFEERKFYNEPHLNESQK